MELFRFASLGLKFEWVTTHWIAGVVLAALVTLHIVRACFWLDFWSMVVGFDDVRSGWRAVRQAFGRKGPPPLKPGKYSLLQKLYHLAVTAVVLALAATGLECAYSPGGVQCGTGSVSRSSDGIKSDTVESWL